MTKVWCFSGMVLGSILGLTGCVSPAVYRDPRTGVTANCASSTPGIFPLIAQYEVNQCAASYERMGWKRQ